MLTRDELDNRFDHHPPPSERVVHAHEEVRGQMKAVATLLCQLVPPGRELALALTSLEDAMFWANAAIARNPERVPL